MKSKQVQEFKETEIGKIPSDWEVDKLENHLIIKGRIGWKNLKISEYTDVGPFIVGGLQFYWFGLIVKIAKSALYE